MKSMYFLLSVFLLCSCNTNSHQKNLENKFKDSPIVLLYQMNIEKLTELKNEALLTGDTAKYSEAKAYYLETTQLDQLLYCSLVMANKYNYKAAYYDVYFALSHPRTGEVFNSLDSTTQSLALYYLLKSYELGYESAIYHIYEILGENSSIPKSSNYLKSMKINR